MTGVVRYVPSVLLGAMVWLAGCGGVEPDSSVSHEGLTGSFGEILVTYRQSLTERTDDGPSPFQISARFVRVRDLGWHEVRDLWGDELPPMYVPRGECRSTDFVVPRQDDVLSGSLELLDAGELSLTVDEEELRVPSQSFPSVFGFAAGVEYEGEALDTAFRPERTYRLTAGGGTEIGAFDVDLVAPEEFESLSVGGAEAGLEAVTIDASGRPLEVRWEPGRGTAEALLELSYSHFGIEQRFVCSASEDGLIEVPSRLVGRLLEAGVSDARLVVYRVVRSEFHAEGLDEAEALFVVSAVVPVGVP